MPMTKNSALQSGILYPRVLFAFALCSVGALLALAALDGGLSAARANRAGIAWTWRDSGQFWLPFISPDARYIVFDSYDANLTPNDTNGTYDAFLHDRVTRITERVSVGPNQAEG